MRPLRSQGNLAIVIWRKLGRIMCHTYPKTEFCPCSSPIAEKVFSLLPDYVLPYAIHLLAHDPELQSNEDVTTLKNVRE